MMAALPRLVTLPEELFEHITSYLDPIDFLAIRRTSRAFATAIETQFLDAHFSTRSHLFTLHGIETLARIADYPKLIHHVKKLRLAFVTPVLNWLSRSIGATAQQAWKQDQKTLKAMSPVLLVKFFSAIAAGPHARTLELEFINMCPSYLPRDPPSGFYGVTQLGTLLGVDSTGDMVNFDSWRADSHSCLVLSVVAQIERLSISTLRIIRELQPLHGDEANDFQFVFDPPMHAEKALFANLTTLDLDFGHVYFEEVEMQDQFYDLLGHAGLLEVLVLGGYGGWASNPAHDGTCFHKIAESVPLEAPLRHLALSWFDVHERDLMALLGRKIASLQHLDIKELTLGKNGTWHRILALLQTQGSSLKRVAFGNLRCDDEEIQHPLNRLHQLVLGVTDEDDPENLVREFSFHGKEEVESGIKKLIEEGKYGNSDI